MKKLTNTLLTTALLALPIGAQAITFQFNASLSGASEVPASGATGTGLATLFYNDNNSVLTTDDSFSFTLGAFGLSGPVIGAHIHAAPVGVNGPVVVNLANSPFLALNSGGTLLIGGTNVLPPTSSFLTLLQAGLGYINVHTGLNPGGELRGQLTHVSAVPEPSTYMMLLAGLGLIGVMVRNRAKNRSF